MQTSDLLASVRRLDWNGALNTFLALPSRQQTIVLAGAIAIAAMVILVPLGIVVSSLQSMEAQIAETRGVLTSLTIDIQKYRDANAEVTALQKVFAAQSADSLRTAISRVGSESSVKVDDMSERGNKESFDFHEEEKGSFQLKGIAIKDLVAFLHKLETSTQRIIRVKKMIVRPDQRKRDQLNVDFSEVSAYRLLEGSSK